MKAKKQNREPEFGMPRLIPFREKSKSAGIKFGKASTKGLPGLFSSFKYAASGFVLCVKRERNMRIHLSAAFYAFLFSLFYDFAPGDYALLAIVCGLVMFAECVNTAVESVCDLYTESYSEKVMCAKD
ncbi:MAG: diacylglycerol kinase family protein, partial [Oscillospiraceae bacterium]|nr:diacylglycerol kinase family protein [Oscillospiraceae bacterium]